MLEMNRYGKEAMEIADFETVRNVVWPETWCDESRDAALSAEARRLTGEKPESANGSSRSNGLSPTGTLMFRQS